jgi:hypothetical protein
MLPPSPASDDSWARTELTATGLLSECSTNPMEDGHEANANSRGTILNVS